MVEEIETAFQLVVVAERTAHSSRTHASCSKLWRRMPGQLESLVRYVWFIYGDILVKETARKETVGKATAHIVVVLPPIYCLRESAML